MLVSILIHPAFERAARVIGKPIQIGDFVRIGPDLYYLVGAGCAAGGEDK
jgi:hypothetical protein